MLKGKTGAVVGLVILSSLSLSACTSSSSSVPQAQVHRGTVNLDAVRVGTPETVFKEAIMTFIPDANGTMEGKTQYLSRMPNSNGGQYVIQAKNDVCYEVDVIHTTPVSKEIALKTMKGLLPSNVTDEAVITIDNKTATPIETYQYGTGYVGHVFYKDKTGTAVSTVSINRVPTADVATGAQAQ